MLLFILTSYHMSHIFDILLADNLCFHHINISSCGLAFQETVGQDKQMVEAWRGRGGEPLDNSLSQEGGRGGLSPHTLEISP